MYRGFRMLLCQLVLSCFVANSLMAQKAPDEGPTKPVETVSAYLESRLGDSGCNSSISPIPDNTPGGVTSTIVDPGTGTVDSLSVDLSITHSWVGDLVVTLEHEGLVAVLMDQPGLPESTFGCSGNNISVNFDDAASQPVEDVCPATDPVLNGSFQPVTPLSVFYSTNAAGTWTLTVSDNFGGDTGTIDEWCVFQIPDECFIGMELRVDGIHITGGCEAVDIYAERRYGPSEPPVLLYSAVTVDGIVILPIPSEYYCNYSIVAVLSGGAYFPIVETPPLVCEPVLTPWGMFLFVTLLAGTAVFILNRRRQHGKA